MTPPPRNRGPKPERKDRNARRDKPSQGRGPSKPLPRPSAGRLEIVYEDADLLVVNKPRGMQTASPTPTSSRTIFDLVKDHVRKRGGRRSRAWIIHRLDQDASGLVVFATSERAYDKLKDELRARRIHRIYFALVEGRMPVPPGDSGTVQSLLRERKDGHVEAVPADRPADPTARPAVTHYRVEASTNEYSLLRVRLETGRKHQIRAHLAGLGHPIVGDRRYGAASNPLRRLALHATELRFHHPSTGEPLHFQSSAPTGFFSLAGTSPPAGVPENSRPPMQPVRVPHLSGLDTSWQGVSEWYDDYQKGPRSDHFTDVILPGTLALLGDVTDRRVLDVACGEGSFASVLASQRARVVGVDAAASLIAAAQSRRIQNAGFLVGDARELGTIDDPMLTDPFDAATCIMALMNIDPMAGLARGVASRLRTGGRFVAVMLHPAFRSPKRTSWDWDRTRSANAKQTQYRRIEAYLSHSAEQIVMNPGEVSEGGRPVVTWTFHRPLESYIACFAEAGLLVDALEEWPSRRTSQPGPRAAAENKARREIPMFIAIRCVKIRGEA